MGKDKDKGKVDRFLNACHVGKKDKAGGAKGGAPQVKELTFKTHDLVPELNGQLDKLKLGGSRQITVRVKLFGEVLEKHEKNDLFEGDVRRIANNALATETKDYFESIATFLKAREKAGQPSDEVQRAFDSVCDDVGVALSLSLQDKVAEYVQSNKAIKRAYRRYQVRCVNDVVSDLAIIGTSIGLTAASWGTTGPVAVVAVVRSCVGVCRQVHDMAMSAWDVMEVIEQYFKALGDVMDAADTDQRTKNTALEVGIGAIAGLLNVELPSVAAIEEKMKLLDDKLRGVHARRIETGKEIAKLRLAIDAYGKKIEENKDNPKYAKDKLAKHEAKRDRFRAVREALIESAEDMYKNVLKAISNQKDYEAQLKSYKDNVSTRALKARLVFGVATTLGLAAGAGSSGLAKALVAASEALRVAEEVLEEEVG